MYTGTQVDSPLGSQKNIELMIPLFWQRTYVRNYISMFYLILREPGHTVYCTTFRNQDSTKNILKSKQYQNIK